MRSIAQLTCQLSNLVFLPGKLCVLLSHLMPIFLANIATIPFSILFTRCRPLLGRHGSDPILISLFTRCRPLLGRHSPDPILISLSAHWHPCLGRHSPNPLDVTSYANVGMNASAKLSTLRYCLVLHPIEQWNIERFHLRIW